MSTSKHPADGIRGQDWNGTNRTISANPEGKLEVENTEVVEVLKQILVEQRRTNAFLAELFGDDISEGDIE